MTTKDLTRAELEIMQILWRKESAFVNELIDEMPDPKPAYNTVSTVVRILEKKGVVDHQAFGKSHRYHPLINKDEYTHGFMHGVMSNFFDNSISQMFSFFSARENLSIKEMEQIASMAQKIIDEKSKK